MLGRENIVKPHKLLLRSHQYRKAAELLEEELKTARAKGDKHNLLQNLLELGVCYYETGQLSEAQNVLEEALNISRTDNNKHGIVMTLHELSNVVSAQGDPNKAINLCKESIDLEIDLGGEAALQLNTLSVLYQKVGRFAEALEILEIVRESCESRHDLQSLGRCLNEMGLTSMQLGNLDSAVKYMAKSIELKHHIGDERGIKVTLRNLNICLQSNPHAIIHTDVKKHLERLEGILK